MHPESFVFFDEADVVSWHKGYPAAFNEPGIVEIWRLYFPSCIDRISELYEILHPEEKRKSSLFFHKSDRQKFIIGKAMLRMILGGYLNINPGMLTFSAGMYMKPVLKVGNDIPFHFNISHSGDYILIAVSDSPIGVDIEHYQTGLNIHEVMEIAFSEKEIDFIKEQVIPQKAFFQLWTRKEALIKATSRGLNNDIRYIPCLNGKHHISPSLINNGQDWHVSNFHVDTEHIGSIAYLKNTREVRFKQFATQRQHVFYEEEAAKTNTEHNLVIIQPDS